MRVKAYSAADTSYMLRKHLGALRGWEDFLADCRRGITSLFGHVLMPVARAKSGAARYLPVYNLADIAQFIQGVRDICPEAKAGVAPIPIMLDIDFVEDRRSWRTRKIEAD